MTGLVTAAGEDLRVTLLVLAFALWAAAAVLAMSRHVRKHEAKRPGRHRNGQG